ncbi:MAG: DUF2782 domain-containing protein [Ketobacteraceae bacterium]|nr:DUF2782 domain-containing protein [Ketobacteraceae bacterium]
MKNLVLACAFLTLPALSLATVVPPEEGSSIAPEPKVTIIDSENKKIEVHEVNGRVYSIKVIPKNGKPYYLVDKQGDGDFIRDSGVERMQIPEWVLISW